MNKSPAAPVHQPESKSRFFLRNLMKGLIWLAVIVALFVFSKHTIDRETLERFEPVFRNNWLVFSIFSLSEVIIGIVPPEVFIIWALRNGSLPGYLGLVLILTLISYAAGIIAYAFGRYLHNTLLYQRLKVRYLKKSEKLLQAYGQYLILVAALTPVPFSGTAMLVGAVHYPVKNYLLISLFRFIKFAVSAWIIWEANRI